MFMSFQEKSLWVSLIGVVLAFGGYFRSVYLMLGQGAMPRDLMPQHSALFLSATVLLVTVLVVGHIVVAIFDPKGEADERDRLIELKGERWGSYVLGTGVFLSLCTAVWTEGNAAMAHVLLGSWALSQAVEIAAQLVMHRRGA